MSSAIFDTEGRMHQEIKKPRYWMEPYCIAMSHTLNITQVQDHKVTGNERPLEGN